jgi:hypothetical protein
MMFSKAHEAAVMAKRDDLLPRAMEHAGSAAVVKRAAPLDTVGKYLGTHDLQSPAERADEMALIETVRQRAGAASATISLSTTIRVAGDVPLFDAFQAQSGLPCRPISGMSMRVCIGTKPC